MPVCPSIVLCSKERKGTVSKPNVTLVSDENFPPSATLSGIPAHFGYQAQGAIITSARHSNVTGLLGTVTESEDKHEDNSDNESESDI